jgi:hypothetical protein
MSKEPTKTAPPAATQNDDSDLDDLLDGNLKSELDAMYPLIVFLVGVL